MDTMIRFDLAFSVKRIPLKFRDNWWTKQVDYQKISRFHILFNKNMIDDYSIKDVILKMICKHAFTTNLAKETEIYLGLKLYSNFMYAISICYEPDDFQNFINILTQAFVVTYETELDCLEWGEKFDKKKFFDNWGDRLDSIVETSGLIKIVCETFKHIVINF